jgi:hypothetical protein
LIALSHCRFTRQLFHRLCPRCHLDYFFTLVDGRLDWSKANGDRSSKSVSAKNVFPNRDSTVLPMRIFFVKLNETLTSSLFATNEAVKKPWKKSDLRVFDRLSGHISDEN